MSHQLWAFMALDVARQRTEEAMRERMVSTTARDVPSVTTRTRRSLARGLAGVSRGSAWLVRRLDDCVADDLGRTLAPTE
jgi:hypothetical protein